MVGDMEIAGDLVNLDSALNLAPLAFLEGLFGTLQRCFIVNRA